MKIIHTADMHLGSAFQGLSPQKAQIRQTELLDGFRRLCVFAKENGVAAVLLVGDLFDEKHVVKSLIEQTLSFIRAAAPVAFFYVSGNHDEGFEGYDDLPENFYTFTGGWKSYDIGENILITGMDTRQFGMENFTALRLNPDKYNILLLHGERTDSANASSLYAIPLGILKNQPIDYLALGHYHQPDLQALPVGVRGVMRYCGCLEGRGFDEIAECGGRGFFLLDIQNKRLQGEKFYSVATRESRLARVDISQCQTYFDVENAILTQTKDIPQKDAVKIVLCGGYRSGLKKDLPLLFARLQERFFHLRIKDESRLAITPTDFANDISPRGEFVREAYAYPMSEEQRSEILEVGLKALAGEAIDL